MVETWPVLWCLVLTWLLGGEMGTSVHAREEVVMVELAFWWQLAVGLQLS